MENSLITVVTDDFSFFSQIMQMIPQRIKKSGVIMLSHKDCLKQTRMIITDELDLTIQKEGVPTFVISDIFPDKIEESISLRFYKKNNFKVEKFQNDLLDWYEIAQTLFSNAEEIRIEEAIRKNYQEKCDDYRHSLKLAGMMQRNVLNPPNLNGFSQAFYYQSACSVSGDFLVIDEMENKIFIVIGDVTNHGYNAGLYGASLVTLIKSYLYMSSRYMLSIQGLLEYLISSKNFYNDVDDRRLATTLLLCSIDKKEHTIEFLNCGHESPVLIHQNKAHFLEMERSIPLSDELTKIPERSIFPFFPGDMIFLNTDGITDIFQNPEEKDIRTAYSEIRLLDSIQYELDRKRGNPQEIIDGVLKDAKSYSITDDFKNQDLSNKTILNAPDDIMLYTLRWEE